MQLLKKLFQIISNFIPRSEGLPEMEASLLTRLNPDKIYVENVRSILGVSYKNALSICETAVRQGVFVKAVEVKCPDGSVAATAPSRDQLPPEVNCWEQEDGHLEPETLNTSELETTISRDEERLTQCDTAIDDDRVQVVSHVTNTFKSLASSLVCELPTC